uniref:Uncharacterized protein LOC105636258 n=1 Tax=Rhizophora mucronata TaxID=61149 RepID=A0A2P2IJR1_RHIMU
MLSSMVFVDAPDVLAWANKKQDVGIPIMNLFSGFLNFNVSPWANTSNFQSIASPSEHLFDSETHRTMNF